MARVSGLAAGGHVVASVVLAGIVALIGLQFRQQVEAQQGHIVGAVLVLTGAGFLIWGLTGYGHPHSHGGDGPGEEHHHDDHLEHESEESHKEYEHGHRDAEERVPDDAQAHMQVHTQAQLTDSRHGHQHAHGKVVHSHEHKHEAFIKERKRLLETHSQGQTLAARLATIAVPFGVAASPDLTLLPIAFAAAAYSASLVVLTTVVFAIVTIATFVGLTVGATAAGYQVKGLWLEKHANNITALVLIVIGVAVFLGL